MKPGAFPPPALAVALHDVAPETWPRCAALLDAVAEVAPVPVTLLVVPNYHRRNPGTPDWYRDALDDRLARGDELALHGFFHLDESPRPHSPGEWWRRRVMTAAEGEFSALPLAHARRRLRRGREWFGRHGWPVRGFVAPAWLLGRGAWHAAATSPFAYTTTATHFHLLHPWQRVRAPVIGWSTRSRARRVLSLAWHGLRPVPQDPALVRIALHPDDALHPRIVRQAQRILEALLRTRTPMTKIAFASAMRPARLGTRAQRTGTTSSDSDATPAPIATPASTSLG